MAAARQGLVHAGAGALLVALLTSAAIADRWELLLRDAILRLLPKRPAQHSVVLLVDEEALHQRPWPWPRGLWAEVVREVASAGSRAVVVDVLFLSPSPQDAELAQALRQLPSLLAVARDPNQEAFLLPPEPLRGASQLAHAAFAPDADGVVRRLPTTQQAGHMMLPALAAAAACLVDSSQALPVGRSLRPDFRTPARAVPQLSVADLWRRREAVAAQIRGKLVWLGASAVGLGDQAFTPTSGRQPVPGVTVHAAMTEAILQGGLLRPIPPWLQALAAGLLVLLVHRFWPRPHPLAVLILAPLLPTGLQFATLAWFHLQFASLTLGLVLAASLAVRQGRIVQRLGQLLQSKGRHLSPEARLAELQRVHQQLLAAKEQEVEQRRLLVHELKTPLSALAALSQLLRNYQLSHEERERVLQLLAAESARATKLVEELLELERLQQQPFVPDPEPVVLDALAEERAQLAAATSGREVVVLVEARNVKVLGRRSKLAQALDNLLSNAVNYSPPQTPITVRVALERTHGVLEVVDQGPGVPEAERVRIFQRFMRGQAAAGKPGLGLGLAVVAEVIRWHGGRVEVEEGPSGGALFRLLLPLARGA